MGLLLVVLLTVGLIATGNGEVNDTCTYPTLCEKIITINRPCYIYPPCRDIIIPVPCIETGDCAISYDSWSKCSCFTDTRTRLGLCSGSECSKVVSETENCDPYPCKYDGQWASWNTWVETPCSESCCGGVQNRTRTRTCTHPPPRKDGKFCPGDDTETEVDRECNTQDCPVICMGNAFEPDPCGVCVPRYFSCGEDLVPVEQMCPSPNVWSISFNTCVPSEICVSSLPP